MFGTLRKFARHARYQPVSTLIGQSVQVNGFQSLVDDVHGFLQERLELKAEYLGRWNTAKDDKIGLRATSYAFAVIGHFDMKFTVTTVIGSDRFKTGIPLLREMVSEVDLLLMDEGDIEELAQEAGDNQLYLLLLFAVDPTHRKFKIFREKIRAFDAEAINTGRSGIPPDYFPVMCKIVDAAVTNVPHLWKYRHAQLWMYTYVY